MEDFPAGTEVHAEVAHGAQRRILALVGIEQTRLLTGSGPQVKWACLLETALFFHLDHLIPVL